MTGFRNPTALVQIIDDLEAWCDERGIKKVTELIGAVNDKDFEMDSHRARRRSASEPSHIRLPLWQAHSMAARGNRADNTDGAKLRIHPARS